MKNINFSKLFDNNIQPFFYKLSFFIEGEQGSVGQRGSVGQKGSQGQKGQKGMPGTCDDLVRKDLTHRKSSLKSVTVLVYL